MFRHPEEILLHAGRDACLPNPVPVLVTVSNDEAGRNVREYDCAREVRRALTDLFWCGVPLIPGLQR